MPISANGESYNMVWKLRCDAQTRSYTLTVELYSGLSDRKHEELHRKVVMEVREWLVAQNLDPDAGEIRIEHIRIPEAEYPIPDPNSRADNNRVQEERVAPIQTETQSEPV